MDDGHLNTAINKYLFSIITTYRKFVKETKKKFFLPYRLENIDNDKRCTFGLFLNNNKKVVMIAQSMRHFFILLFQPL